MGSIVLTALLAGVGLVVARGRARGVVLLVAVLVGLPFHEAAGNLLEDWVSPPPTSADAAARRYGRRAAQVPLVRKALEGKTQREADDLAAGFAAGGLSTLTDAQLDQRARLLKLLADGPDDVLAAGLFTGQLDPVRLKAALNKLPPADIDAWYRLTYEATVGFFEDNAGQQPDAREKARAMRLLVAATQLEGTRLMGVFQDPHPGVAEAAWAARKVYDTLAGMPLDQRVAVERTLAAPKSGYAKR